jgi:hypothetical protein
MFFPVIFYVIEVFVGREYGGVVQWNTRRSLAEENAGNSSLILAETRPYMKDPLDGFNRYSGGWNISNQHYWVVSVFCFFNLPSAIWSTGSIPYPVIVLFFLQQVKE